VKGWGAFNAPEHLKVTTLQASSIKALPVCGFLPRRFFLSFTWNLKVIMGSPDWRVDFMSSKSDWTNWPAVFLGKPLEEDNLLMRWSLRNVMIRVGICNYLISNGY